jgi:phosphoenolpyruvate carboxykinase (ATP)
MPGTENGVKEIKRICSPCYGSPFMPLSVKAYSHLLMKRVKDNDCNVFLVNTGMNAEGERFALEYTRKCIKDAINSNIPAIDTSNEISDILKECLRG